MEPTKMYFCEICGATEKRNGWFLVSEDRDGDTLQILMWNRQLADHPGMRHLCSAAHVEELVSHWMLTGSLNYGHSRPGCEQNSPAVHNDNLDLSYRLGELMLDRSSFAALGERPDMLSSILEAIDGALQSSAEVHSLLEEEEEKQEEEETTPIYDA